MDGYPWFQGVAKPADIGRIASKHVKVTVSGKNSLTAGKGERAVTPKKGKQNTANDTMNHVNDRDNQQSEPEDMDTREGALQTLTIQQQQQLPKNVNWGWERGTSVR